MFKYFRNLDWPFFMATLLLAGLGLVVQYSLSFSRAAGGVFFMRHAIFVLIGLVLFFVIAAIDFREWEAWRWWLYGGGLLLLLLVLIAGVTQRGTRGWFGFGALTFQVVELLKPILAIVLSGFWAGRSLYLSRWQDILTSGLIAGLPIVLVIMQPDFGSAAVLMALWLATLLLIDRKSVV